MIEGRGQKIKPHVGMEWMGQKYIKTHGSDEENVQAIKLQACKNLKGSDPSEV